MDFNAAFEYVGVVTRARVQRPRLITNNKIVIIIKNDTALWSNVNLMSTQEKKSVKSCGVIAKRQWLGVVNSQNPAQILRYKNTKPKEMVVNIRVNNKNVKKKKNTLQWI